MLNRVDAVEQIPLADEARTSYSVLDIVAFGAELGDGSVADQAVSGELAH
ncbi:hypothetical protein ACWFR1_39415 [Streptomyces sp. NPDC055103]